MNIKTLGFSLLTAGVLGAGSLSTPALAQSFSAGVDRTLPRYCKNGCAQTNEQIVVDGNGNAVAMWNEGYYVAGGPSGGYDALIASRYTASTNSWSAPKPLFESALETPRGKLGMDAAGNATLVFAHNGYAGGDHTLYAARWIAGYGFRLDNIAYRNEWYVSGGNSGIAASVGRNGHITVNYKIVYEGGRFYQSESRTLAYSPVTKGWSATIQQGEDFTFDQVVTDPSGNAIGFKHGASDWSYRYDRASQSWSRLSGLFTYSIRAGYQLSNAVDRSGNVMVIAELINTTTNTSELKTMRYEASTRRWSTKWLPKISSSRVYGSPSIAADRYNNFYATWVQYSGGYMKTISARYSNSAGVWSKPVVISKGNYHTRDAAVAVDYAGNAIYAWSQRTDTGTGSSYGKIFRTTAVRYSNWRWGWPSVVQDAYRIGYKPFIGADNSGRAVVMWTQNSSVSGMKEIKSDRLIPK